MSHSSEVYIQQQSFTSTEVILQHCSFTSSEVKKKIVIGMDWTKDLADSFTSAMKFYYNMHTLPLDHWGYISST